MEDTRPVFYRLYDTYGDEGHPPQTVIHVMKFYGIRETPRGWWVVSEYGPDWLTSEELIRKRYAKWISNTSRKRHCYPTLEQAIESFKARKFHQVNRLENQLRQARAAAKFETATLDELSLYNGVSIPWDDTGLLENLQ